LSLFLLKETECARNDARLGRLSFLSLSSYWGDCFSAGHSDFTFCITECASQWRVARTVVVLIICRSNREIASAQGVLTSPVALGSALRNDAWGGQLSF